MTTTGVFDELPWPPASTAARLPVYFISFGSPGVYRAHLSADVRCSAYSPRRVEEAATARRRGRLKPVGRSPVTTNCMPPTPAAVRVR
jgi:hypothetical protein